MTDQDNDATGAGSVASAEPHAQNDTAREPIASERLMRLAEFRDLSPAEDPPSVRVRRMMREMVPLLEGYAPRAAVTTQTILDRHVSSGEAPFDASGDGSGTGNLSEVPGDGKGNADKSDYDLGVDIMTLADIADDLCRAGLASAAAVYCGYANSLLAHAVPPIETLGAEPAVDPSDSPSGPFDPATDPGVARLRVVSGILALHIGMLEDAERLFAAAAAISERTNDNHGLGNAHLNLANVARLQGLAHQANLAAENADRHYRAAGDDTGHAMALLTLSSIAAEENDTARSSAFLAEAESVIWALDDDDLKSSVFGQRAQNLAVEGHHAEAEREFKRSLHLARLSGNIDKQATALHSLASLAQNSGDAGLALRRYRRVAQFAEQHQLVERQLHIYPALVQTLAATGRKTEALETARRLHRMNGDLDRPTGGSGALLAATLMDNGDVANGCDHALRAMDELVDRDPDGMWPSNIRNLISGLRGQGRLGEFAQSLADAIRTHAAAGKRASSTGNEAGLLQHLGIALAAGTRTKTATATVATELVVEALLQVPSEDRAWDALMAESELNRAAPQMRLTIIELGLEAARAHGQATVERQLLNDLAIAHSDLGDLSAARSQLEANTAAARDAADIEAERIAQFNLAETYRRLDRPEQARDCASRALELAVVLGDEKDIGESRLRLAQVLTDLGRFEESRAALQDLLDAPGSSPDLFTQATASLGRAEIALGNYSSAAELYGKAARTEPRTSIQYSETLIALCEALAHLDNRRSYARRLQQWIDTIQDNDFESEWAVPSMLRIAQTWADGNRLRYSGEMLALLILLAVHETPDDISVNDSAGPSESDGAYEVGGSGAPDHSARIGNAAEEASDEDATDAAEPWRPAVAMYVAAAELARQRSAGLITTDTEAAIEKQLREVADGEMATRVLAFVREIADTYDADESNSEGSA